MCLRRKNESLSELLGDVVMERSVQTPLSMGLCADRAGGPVVVRLGVAVFGGGGRNSAANLGLRESLIPASRQGG